MNPYDPPVQGPTNETAGRVPVRASGLVTADDAIRALKAVRKWHAWRGTVMLVIVLGTMFAYSFVLLGQKWDVIWGVFLFGSVILITFLHWLTGRRFVKAWQARVEMTHPVSWVFSDDGCYVETIHSKHLNAWESYLYARFTNDLLILAQHGNAMFNFVPRRFFESEQDWLAVKGLIASKLPVRV